MRRLIGRLDARSRRKRTHQSLPTGSLTEAEQRREARALRSFLARLQTDSYDDNVVDRDGHAGENEPAPPDSQALSNNFDLGL